MHLTQLHYSYSSLAWSMPSLACDTAGLHGEVYDTIRLAYKSTHWPAVLGVAYRAHLSSAGVWCLKASWTIWWIALAEYRFNWRSYCWRRDRMQGSAATAWNCYCQTGSAMQQANNAIECWDATYTTSPGVPACCTWHLYSWSRVRIVMWQGEVQSYWGPF